MTDLLLLAPSVTGYPVKCVLMSQGLGGSEETPEYKSHLILFKIQNSKDCPYREFLWSFLVQ